MSLFQLPKQIPTAAIPAQISNLLQPGARCLYVAHLLDQVPHICLIVENKQEAERSLHFLQAMGIKDAHYFPTPALSPYEWNDADKSSLAQRQRLRYRLLHTPKPPRCLLITDKGLAHLMMSREVWFKHCLTLRPGDTSAPQAVVQTLVHLGYKPVDRVREPGEFTRRGGLLDLFPLSLEEPIKMEWFGDEIERIWRYQPNTFESLPLDGPLVIPPVWEWMLPDDYEPLQDKLPQENRVLLWNALCQWQYKPEMRSIMALFHPVTSILDSLAPGTLIMAPADLDTRLKANDELWQQQQQDKNRPPAHLSLAKIQSLRHPFATLHLGGHDGTNPGALLPPLERQFDLLAPHLAGLAKSGRRIMVVTNQPQRTLAILQERNCPVVYGESLDLSKPVVWVMRGSLPEGFAFSPLNLFCFTDAELFETHAPLKTKAATKPVPTQQQLQLEQLKPGMLVVHEVHGVGQYRGLMQASTTGATREYLEIYYAAGDKLLVPVEQMNRLQLYHGIGHSKMALSKMGGAEWEKVKKKVRKAVQDIAEELLATEARRAQVEGIAFPPDTPWQHEMELAFPYEETPDQWRAIVDTKQDMEKPIPMDRVVCGDVGFGKTEVAIRAAFKAAMAGKQVAVLAPTTILAQQHYQVFKERFAAYPVKLAALSRYRTKKEADQIFADLKAGAVDVVIATHRLLADSVSFRDLGLLIIDEEHRFGVQHKEKLKKIKAQVDILSMSATPIPRTLHMALSGVRALSVINTPPPERYPIQTIVAPNTEQSLKEAILNELERGGQVFYVHNRVESIGEIAEKLHELVPNARFRVAHGQMPKQFLEDTMLAFYNYEFDILICTTIVESGIDIPNVNTLIVDRVDLLGLAQLHQLRGRVGRSNVQAYAYLFYEPNKPLTVEATERLLAIQEFSQLGSGYYIALKDMEIRGIGDLLGSQQHGHIVAVGFETYCQMLEETIAALRGDFQVRLQPIKSVVDLNLTAYIPDQWVKDPNEKMQLYRTLSYLDDLSYLEELESKSARQYGPLPEAAAMLWRVTRMRIIMGRIGAERIGFTGAYLELRVKLTEIEWREAGRRQPLLRRWHYFPNRLQVTPMTRINDNLKLIEELLGTLLTVTAHKEGNKTRV